MDIITGSIIILGLFGIYTIDIQLPTNPDERDYCKEHVFEERCWSNCYYNYVYNLKGPKCGPSTNLNNLEE